MSSTDSTNYDLVPASLAVKAMRDNGYRNAAYAAAELMDNSIQANASQVELIVHEETDLVSQRRRSRVKEIGILDDGHGMDARTLRKALQFGNGSHLDDRSGMGRFGMGLPSASISQCTHVDVWTWTNGPDSALYTYMDIGEVVNGTMRQVPEPVSREVPAKWRTMGNKWGKSGTLVVWSHIDRCIWRTGRAIMDNSEFLIARMYRRFLHEGSVSIRMATFEDASETPKHEWFARPNDPGYLMVPSMTPAPYDETPMFQLDGDNAVWEHRIGFAGEQHNVRIRFSYAKEEVRAGSRNAGGRDFGKHAAKNVGVSVVRAGRELDMVQAFLGTGEYRDRWWGVEVEFPPALDELFGVTNNKQEARNFTDLAERYDSTYSKSDEWSEFSRSLREDGDARAPLLEIISTISSRINVLRLAIDQQNRGADRARRRHDPDSAEAAATAATQQRIARGSRGESDEDQGLTEVERSAQIAESLIEAGLGQAQAEEMAAYTVDNGLKYVFTEARLDGTTFFSVAPRAGEILIKVNMDHPAYKNLVEVLDRDESANLTAEKLAERLDTAREGLKLLLMAWARHEDEQVTNEARALVQDTRVAWGRMAWEFMK